MCILYETYHGKNLNYKSRIDCKNRQGKYSAGRKVAGISFLDNLEFLVSTNDSRLRLYSVLDCMQQVKFKGHLNDTLPMVASMDGKGEVLCSGSEDGFVYFWDRDILKSHGSIDSERNLGHNYIKEKENRSESIIPFSTPNQANPKNAPLKQTANIAQFAPNSTVELANEMFRDFQKWSESSA
jgi:WD40 repeat protein